MHATNSPKRPITITDILNAKRDAKNVRKLAMVTAYDAPSARIAEAGGVDMILVGDSVAMTVQGKNDTNTVSMDEMIYHTSIVTRVASSPLVVGDMPFLSYEESPEQALRNAGRLFREAGVRAVKVEGGRQIVPQILAMTRAGIPVMGHLGLTPQRAAMLGGFKAQARTAESAQALLEDALALEAAGCFSIVIECVPPNVAQRVTSCLSIPTIGIGAGPHCDGQVLVFHDMLGLGSFSPKFAKQYAQLANIATLAVSDYVDDVRGGTFPAPEHTFSMPQEQWDLWENGGGSAPTAPHGESPLNPIA